MATVQGLSEVEQNLIYEAIIRSKTDTVLLRKILQTRCTLQIDYTAFTARSKTALAVYSTEYCEHAIQCSISRDQG